MIRDLHQASEETLQQAGRMLTEVFSPLGSDEWRTEAQGLEEVHACCDPSYVCLGIWEQDELAGWGGARPMYHRVTWELHPLVITRHLQGRGLGEKLLYSIEQEVLRLGGQGIVLGTDDENGRTNLNELNPALQPLELLLPRLENPGNHPYSFYQRQGYRIVGIIPNTTGSGIHDILMWKAIVD